MSASQSVLYEHRYRRVIESLSKSKFAVLSPEEPEKTNCLRRVAAQKINYAGEIGAAMALGVEQGIELRRFGAKRRHRARAKRCFLGQFEVFQHKSRRKSRLVIPVGGRSGNRA